MRALRRSEGPSKVFIDLMATANSAAALEGTTVSNWQKTWHQRLRWIPTSKEAIIASERRLLSLVKTPYFQEQVNIGSGPPGSSIRWFRSASPESRYINTVTFENKSENAPTLVMVHGYGASQGFFFRNFDTLAKHFRVIAIDQLGWGESSRPDFTCKSTEGEVSLYERLAEMNTSGFCITNSSSANGLLPAEVDVPNHSLVNKPACLVELSSQWNFSGRLSCQLHRHFKDNVVCLHDGGKCHHNFNCDHNLKSIRCSFQVNEKVPSIFPINLSSSLREWISQLFSDSEEERSKQGNALSDAQPCGFESFGLEYDSKRALDRLHTYTVQPFKHIGGLSFGPEDPSEQIFGAKALAGMAITDLVSAIPSVHALQTLPYFDLLHSDISRAPEISNYFTHGGGMSSFDCSKEARSDCARSARCVTPDQLRFPDALATWLNDRLPSGILQWGTAPGTKQVTNLWIELIEGEIVLEDTHPPKRTVHVASVKIKNEAGQMLVEAHQEMADGSIRPRNRPLSEKMRRGEKVEEACFRGIFEELGCQLGPKNRVRVLPDSYRWKQEERESLSYPGLLTSYFIHSMDATVEDLPDTGFYTVEDEMVGWNAMETGQSGLNSHEGILRARKFSNHYYFLVVYVKFIVSALSMYMMRLLLPCDPTALNFYH